MNVGMLYSRVRVEERLLLEEFERRRVPVSRIDDGSLVLDLSSEPISYDVVLERSVGHSRGQYAIAVLGEAASRKVHAA